MSTTESAGVGDPVYWDPYRPDIGSDPYPVFRRLRQEAPLYYNKEYDFYAVSRFSDVERCLADRETFSSARSDILEFIKADMEVPKGMFIWEDPPLHTVYRSVVARVFTPRRMNDLEHGIRAYCARCLDPLVGADRIDFIADLGAQLPGGVIGMLLGIPDEDRDVVRERVESALRTETGKPMEVSQASYHGEGFESYVDWRVKNPSEDLMTELLRAEFQDETGTTRRLTRDDAEALSRLDGGPGEREAFLVVFDTRLGYASGVHALGRGARGSRRVASGARGGCPGLESARGSYGKNHVYRVQWRATRARDSARPFRDAVRGGNQRARHHRGVRRDLLLRHLSRVRGSSLARPGWREERDGGGLARGGVRRATEQPAFLPDQGHGGTRRPGCPPAGQAGLSFRAQRGGDTTHPRRRP